MDGTLMKEQSATGRFTALSLDLAGGMYIVRCGKQAVKIVVE
jgi:hypothetical protein